jgi:hypothetical protein
MVRRALKDLPRDLGETYVRILRRIDQIQTAEAGIEDLKVASICGAAAYGHRST